MIMRAESMYYRQGNASIGWAALTVEEKGEGEVD